MSKRARSAPWVAISTCIEAGLAAGLALAVSFIALAGEPYRWSLPPGRDPPPIPVDNPMSADKVELGRHLFHDRRLSATGEVACASCHIPRRAFTDGREHAVGIAGTPHPRNAPSLANAGYSLLLAWADPVAKPLESQLLTPLFGTHPVEMGMGDRAEMIVALLRDDPVYRRLVPAAFPGEAPSIEQAAKAIAAFERTLVSADSSYDRYRAGDRNAITAEARRGEALFKSTRLGCANCHKGPDLGATDNDRPFRNTGLYNIDGTGRYPVGDTGLAQVTGRAEDMGKFRIPSLRNVALTGPYMHDGSIPSLRQVLYHYEAGGRTIETGPLAGVGSTSPYKDRLIRGFTLSREEEDAVIVFLESLTDRAFATDPRFGDPFATPPGR